MWLSSPQHGLYQLKNDILPLMISNCAMAGCHDVVSHKEGIILTNYQNIIQTGGVRPGDPGDSELFDQIIETRLDKRMPPPRSAAFSPTQIALVKKWIAQGARNNRCDANVGGCDRSNLSYTNTTVPILKARRVGCHNNNLSSRGINLRSQAQTVAAASSGRLLGSVKR